MRGTQVKKSEKRVGSQAGVMIGKTLSTRKPGWDDGK